MGSDSDETVSSHSEGALDEDGRDGGGDMSGNQDKMLSRAQHIWNSGSVGSFAGGLGGLKITRGNKNSILILFFSFPWTWSAVGCRGQY